MELVEQNMEPRIRKLLLSPTAPKPNPDHTFVTRGARAGTTRHLNHPARQSASPPTPPTFLPPPQITSSPSEAQAAIAPTVRELMHASVLLAQDVSANLIPRMPAEAQDTDGLLLAWDRPERPDPRLIHYLIRLRDPNYDAVSAALQTPLPPPPRPPQLTASPPEIPLTQSFNPNPHPNTTSSEAKEVKEADYASSYTEVNPQSPQTDLPYLDPERLLLEQELSADPDRPKFKRTRLLKLLKPRNRTTVRRKGQIIVSCHPQNLTWGRAVEDILQRNENNEADDKLTDEEILYILAQWFPTKTPTRERLKRDRVAYNHGDLYKKQPLPELEQRSHRYEKGEGKVWMVSTRGKKLQLIFDENEGKLPPAKKFFSHNRWRTTPEKEGNDL